MDENIKKLIILEMQRLPSIQQNRLYLAAEQVTFIIYNFIIEIF